MPLYDYECQVCGHLFTKSKSISEREAPLEEACPSCSIVGGVKKVIIGAPTLTAGVNVTNKIPHFFKDRLREIKKDRNTGGNIDHLI